MLVTDVPACRCGGDFRSDTAAIGCSRSIDAWCVDLSPEPLTFELECDLAEGGVWCFDAFSVDFANFSDACGGVVFVGLFSFLRGGSSSVSVSPGSESIAHG
jgi:hypothetical protein